MAGASDAKKAGTAAPDDSTSRESLGGGGAGKPGFEEYEDWLENKIGLTSIRKEKARYEQVSAKAVLDIQGSPFWARILSDSQEVDDRYTQKTSYKLFAAIDQYKPVLSIKPWRSFLLKTFRKNVLNNPNWPKPPEGGWWTSDNWYTRVNDIVRTTVVVKYLDGVEFLVEHIASVADTHGLEFRCDFEAKDEGYYAAHAYVRVPVDVPSLEWDTERVDMQVEIQVTTQLQDVIRRLTHAGYETRRVEGPTGVAWQWQYRGSQFVPNYLGHILHYLEGMIMEVRERPQKKDDSRP